MDSTAKTTSTVESVRAILHGGPESIPNEARVQLVSPLEEKIKLPPEQWRWVAEDADLEDLT